MKDPRQVAALALMYRAAYRTRHSRPSSVDDDYEICPGEVSLAALEASRLFTPLDWEIAVVDEADLILAVAERLVNRADGLRAEALLHAHWRHPRGTWSGSFLGRRWHEVERAIRGLESDGLSATRDEVE